VQLFWRHVLFTVQLQYHKIRVVRGVSVKYISLLDTVLEFCKLFHGLPMNIKTSGDTSLEVTALLWSLWNSLFGDIVKSWEVGENVSNKRCRILNMVYHLLTELKNWGWNRLNGNEESKFFGVFRVLRYLGRIIGQSGIFRENASDESCKAQNYLKNDVQIR